MGGAPRPAVPYIHVAADGSCALAGSRCEACGAVYAGEREVCAACCARGRMRSIALATQGRVHTFTTVCRSFPGVPVPFVMAVVDLDGGPALRGTLAGVAPEAVRFGMRVRVEFRDSGQRDADGNPWIAFCFVPATEDGQR